MCLTGAGGKKTTMYRLAGLHPGRVGVTATVHIPRFPPGLGAREVIAAPESLAAAAVEAAAGARVVAFVQPSQKHGRYAGISGELLAQIHRAAGFAVTLCKADGARSRRIKAPAADEPRVPEAAATVIPVVSAQALGAPLDERVAHRPERLCAVTGAAPGEPLRPRHLARLLASEQGALKGTGRAAVVPLINMVDDARLERLAREAAEEALELSGRFEHVVLAAMRRTSPLVAVVRR